METESATRPISEGEIRADRKVRAQGAVASRGAFDRTLGTNCPHHGALIGVPCWTVRGMGSTDYAAVCDRRIRRAGFRSVRQSRPRAAA